MSESSEGSRFSGALNWVRNRLTGGPKAPPLSAEQSAEQQRQLDEMLKQYIKPLAPADPDAPRRKPEPPAPAPAPEPDRLHQPYMKTTDDPIWKSIGEDRAKNRPPIDYDDPSLE